MTISSKALTVEFLKSCTGLEHLPVGAVPEVAALGRSNVGKSSLLNALFGRDLAHTGKTPGRTRLLNYFSIWHTPAGRKRPPAPDLYLVDFPGYGYAKVSRELWQGWGAVVEPYLLERKQLALSLLLVDGMIPPQAPDLDLFHLLARAPERVLLVATKVDRMKMGERARSLRALTSAFGQPPLPFSAHSGEGRDALWGKIFAASK